ncbi:methyltransferase domain-containing protein [Longispora sp. NPDC051575]|uniref:class I SAM-dependent methyltransferase n=1 Tax=Longispora sp. NPDC051575 TaxID=3154943 RepID=UPI00342D8E02
MVGPSLLLYFQPELNGWRELGRCCCVADVSSTETVPQVFDRLAGDYDEHLPFFTEFGREFLRVLRPGAGARFLDLGCGHGALIGWALEAGCRVTAVDAAPAMVDRVARLHPGAFETRVMDAHVLDLPDGSFDTVAASFVFSLLDDPGAAAREVRRVLVPGGVFALTTPAEPLDADGPTDLAGELFGEFAEHQGEGCTMGAPLDARALLVDGGFTDIREEHIEVRIPVPDPETFWRWLSSHGSAAYLERLPADRRAEFHDRLVKDLAKKDAIILYRAATVTSGRAPE